MIGIELSDGVIRLRPLEPGDAPEHLAGEDEELWRWLSGKQATLEIVEHAIARWRASWRGGGPVRNFGVWETANDRLAGNVEANLALGELGPGEVNISYVVWPQFRGLGYATRAVELMCTYLADATEARLAVIRVDAANARSIAVARRARFTPAPSTEQLLHFERLLTPTSGPT